jgi:hypothetical protein
VTNRGPRAVFPGSFDPLTVAHLAIADAAYEQLGLSEIALAISRTPLGKKAADQTPVGDRLAAIRAAAAHGRPWLTGIETRARLVADIADGYDFVIVGGDKALQLWDPRYYGRSEEKRDEAVARLPRIALAARPGGVVPPGCVELRLPESLGEVSSTGVREGRIEWRA